MPIQPKLFEKWGFLSFVFFCYTYFYSNYCFIYVFNFFLVHYHFSFFSSLIHILLIFFPFLFYFYPFQSIFSLLLDFGCFTRTLRFFFIHLLFQWNLLNRLSNPSYTYCLIRLLLFPVVESFCPVFFIQSILCFFYFHLSY